MDVKVENEGDKIAGHFYEYFMSIMHEMQGRITNITNYNAGSRSKTYNNRVH